MIDHPQATSTVSANSAAFASGDCPSSLACSRMRCDLILKPYTTSGFDLFDRSASVIEPKKLSTCSASCFQIAPPMHESLMRQLSTEPSLLKQELVYKGGSIKRTISPMVMTAASRASR